jgi:hypothetical protein
MPIKFNQHLGDLRTLKIWTYCVKDVCKVQSKRLGSEVWLVFRTIVNLQELSECYFLNSTAHVILSPDSSLD